VSIIKKEEVFERENASESWSLVETKAYHYEDGDCSYKYLFVAGPFVDYISSNTLKMICPH
jgi:hypothetical protein